MYFSAGNTDYWYEVHGTGTPVVLLHGFTGSSRTWDHLIESGSEGVQFIVIDLPGHGRTAGSEVKSMEDCCSDIFQLLVSSGIHYFILAGYSLGGRTALTFALEYPRSVRGLLLESASPGLQSEEERKMRKKNDHKLGEMLKKEGIEAFTAYWENIPLFNSQQRLPDDVKHAIRSERSSQDPHGLARSLEGMGTGAMNPLWGKLYALSCPVLLVTGELDSKFVALNKLMAAGIPDANLEVIGDTGHAVHIEQPEAFNDLVITFANSHAT